MSRKPRSAGPAPPMRRWVVERTLRHGVIWRKTSHGTDSEAVSRYVEQVLTIMATCRQRARDVLGFRARFERRDAPSLLR